MHSVICRRVLGAPFILTLLLLIHRVNFRDIYMMALYISTPNFGSFAQKLFGVQMATFRPKVLAYWTSGKFTDLEQDGSNDE